MWEKKGLVFNVNREFTWNKSHAQTPVVDVLPDRLRIYYATRNSANQSNISYIEVDINNPQNIIYTHSKVLLNLGLPGTFDDSGIMPTSIITLDDKKYLYYIGWTTRKTVPFHNGVGLAISTDGGKTFNKAFEGPIITVNKLEPYFSGTAFVMKEKDNFRMWYLSCIKWEKIEGRFEPFYNIKYAESNNGIDWTQSGKVAINLKPGEGGLVSASVIKNNNKYLMWYGVRGISNYRFKSPASYKIGFATSENGIDWTRDDAIAGIDLSDNAWDSEMISYPYIVEVKDKLLMFYNGNGFGKTGFGFAIWK